MTQTRTPAAQDAFLDRNFPFIDQGQVLPGQFVPSDKPNGARQWQGPTGWRTRHGPAIVRWSLGEPFNVQNALYPDGTRGAANHSFTHGYRRRTSGDRLWVYGSIDIRPDDVVFTDGEQPVYQPPPQSDVPNLEADLARDPAFLAAMKGDRFALAVLSVFQNRRFYKGQDPRAWSCGLDDAAGLVADLRGLGESYLDYTHGGGLAGTYPDDRPDVERQLRSRIAAISTALANGPSGGVNLLELAVLLGPGEHPAEDVQRAMAPLRAAAEKRRAAETEPYREQHRVLLEQAQRALSAFQKNHDNEDAFLSLRSHLTRLGWWAETEQYRRLVHQQWVERALEVLQRIKALELRPVAPAESWTATLRRPAKSSASFDPGEFENMSSDVRDIEVGGLPLRLHALALAGRVTEPEYRALVEQLSPG